jgi:hypothetical protein
LRVHGVITNFKKIFSPRKALSRYGWKSMASFSIRISKMSKKLKTTRKRSTPKWR